MVVHLEELSLHEPIEMSKTEDITVICLHYQLCAAYVMKAKALILVKYLNFNFVDKTVAFYR
jgi:hypothetical protein